MHIFAISHFNLSICMCWLRNYFKVSFTGAMVCVSLGKILINHQLNGWLRLCVLGILHCREDPNLSVISIFINVFFFLFLSLDMNKIPDDYQLTIIFSNYVWFTPIWEIFVINFYWLGIITLFFYFGSWKLIFKEYWTCLYVCLYLHETWHKTILYKYCPYIDFRL